MNCLKHFGIRKDTIGVNHKVRRHRGVDHYDKNGEIIYSNSEYDPEEEQ